MLVPAPRWHRPLKALAKLAVRVMWQALALPRELQLHLPAPVFSTPNREV